MGQPTLAGWTVVDEFLQHFSRFTTRTRKKNNVVYHVTPSFLGGPYAIAKKNLEFFL